MCAKDRGFTLIEILIALTIVSIALAAIVRASSLTIGNLGLLERQSLAMLSAGNVLAELQLGGSPAAPGVSRSDCPQGGIRFVCWLEVGAVVDGLRPVRVEVHAADDGDRLLATLHTRSASP
ncbi:type II secretion system minor pseudopilin GspI [Acidovorax cavernicola]|nr:type II secretion system minor pseudopilin GspI [Acidovorax cavernicola]